MPLGIAGDNPPDGAIVNYTIGASAAGADRSPSEVPVRDPDDRWIVASATAGRADVLVTADQDLLDVADEAPLPILSPRGSWNLLSKK